MTTRNYRVPTSAIANADMSVTLAPSGGRRYTVASITRISPWPPATAWKHTYALPASPKQQEACEGSRLPRPDEDQARPDPHQPQAAQGKGADAGLAINWPFSLLQQPDDRRGRFGGRSFGDVQLDVRQRPVRRLPHFGHVGDLLNRVPGQQGRPIAGVL